MLSVMRVFGDRKFQKTFTKCINDMFFETSLDKTINLTNVGFFTRLVNLINTLKE
jgi:hypothetical protein